MILRTTPTSAQKTLQGIGLLQNSISVLVAKINYRIKIAQEVKFVKGIERREIRSKGVLGMPLDMTPRNLLSDRKYKASLPRRKDWETSTAQLHSNAQIWSR